VGALSRCVLDLRLVRGVYFRCWVRVFVAGYPRVMASRKITLRPGWPGWGLRRGESRGIRVRRSLRGRLQSFHDRLHLRGLVGDPSQHAVKAGRRRFRLLPVVLREPADDVD
jgi:hypothetical protein